MNYISKEEKEIVELLAECFNKFIKLDRQHPNEIDEFVTGIHQCQQLIGMRVARKCVPEIFPIK